MIHNPTKPCSCTVEFPTPNSCRIKYCALHEAAQDLLNALKGFRVLYGPGNMQGDEDAIREEIDVADGAISKAERKP